VRIFRNKPFSRFAKSNGIADEDLREAVSRAVKGIIDANLGSGLIKQRIARTGEGKSGGFRSIILFKKNDRAIFLHGFAKKDIGNIGPQDLKRLRKLAAILAGLTEAQLTELTIAGEIVEVRNHA
jgi:hypothetical protein